MEVWLYIWYGIFDHSTENLGVVCAETLFFCNDAANNVMRVSLMARNFKCMYQWLLLHLGIMFTFNSLKTYFIGWNGCTVSQLKTATNDDTQEITFLGSYLMWFVLGYAVVCIIRKSAWDPHLRDGNPIIGSSQLCCEFQEHIVTTGIMIIGVSYRPATKTMICT